jgi:membrane-associated phospholipid phosphatase
MGVSGLLSGLAGIFKREKENGLVSFETVTLVYIIITTVMIAVEWGSISNPLSMLMVRGIVVAAIGVMLFVYRLYPCRILILLRTGWLFAMLIYWYPETYQFCSIFDYKDHIFAAVDYHVFGCQPSLVFDQILSSTFWYELFNLGYTSYYYLMISMVLFYFIARYRQFRWASFVFLASFFMFYLVFEFLPVAGPQYYYCANGVEMGLTDNFPQMHDYFRTHTEILPLEVRGPFSKMVLAAQEAGEHPTAAFPSSHVGMTVVTLILAWKTGCRKFFWILFPFALILFFATVYVKAHYVVDSVAGILFGSLFYCMANAVYRGFWKEKR